jgi:DNA-binding PadR family transcriptional regulator
MNSNSLRKIHERIVKNFLDIFILAEMHDGPLSGYDLVGIIHKKFNLLMSSGTIYSILYSLERAELVRGRWTERRRAYTLTEKGQKALQDFSNAYETINGFIVNLLKNCRKTHVKSPLTVPETESKRKLEAQQTI